MSSTSPRRRRVNSHREENYLTLLFAIHHTTDNSIIDDLLLRTMGTLDSIPPATLKPEETKRFGDVIDALPDDILSSESVQEARNKERERRDTIEDQQANIQSNGEKEPEETDERLIEIESVNGIFSRTIR